MTDPGEVYCSVCGRDGKTVTLIWSPLPPDRFVCKDCAQLNAEEPTKSPSPPAGEMKLADLIEMADEWPVCESDAGDVFSGDVLIKKLGAALKALEADRSNERQQLQSSRAAMRSALQKHGRHTFDCAALKSQTGGACYPCTCGFGAALAAGEAP